MAGVKCGEINSPESAELIAPMSSLSASLRSDLQSLVNGEMSITSQFTLAKFQLGAHTLPQVLDYAQIYLLIPITGYPLDPKGPTLSKRCSVGQKRGRASGTLPQQPHRSVRDDRFTRYRCTTKGNTGFRGIVDSYTRTALKQHGRPSQSIDGNHRHNNGSSRQPTISRAMLVALTGT